MLPALASVRQVNSDIGDGDADRRADADAEAFLRHRSRYVASLVGGILATFGASGVGIAGIRALSAADALLGGGGAAGGLHFGVSPTIAISAMGVLVAVVIAIQVATRAPNASKSEAGAARSSALSTVAVLCALGAAALALATVAGDGARAHLRSPWLGVGPIGGAALVILVALDAAIAVDASREAAAAVHLRSRRREAAEVLVVRLSELESARPRRLALQAVAVVALLLGPPILAALATDRTDAARVIPPLVGVCAYTALCAAGVAFGVLLIRVGHRAGGLSLAVGSAVAGVPVVVWAIALAHGAVHPRAIADVVIIVGAALVAPCLPVALSSTTRPRSGRQTIGTLFIGMFVRGILRRIDHGGTRADAELARSRLLLLLGFVVPPVGLFIAVRYRPRGRRVAGAAIWVPLTMLGVSALVVAILYLE